MSVAQQLIEDGIHLVLTDGIEALVDDEDPTPFRTVLKGGCAMSQQYLVRRIGELANANTAPAAIIVYAGGATNEGQAGRVIAPEVFTLILINAGRDQETAITGDDAGVSMYELLEWVRQHLHNADGITGVPNNLYWMGNRPFHVPGVLLSAAAFAMDFRANSYFLDGPG